MCVMQMGGESTDFYKRFDIVFAAFLCASYTDLCVFFQARDLQARCSIQYFTSFCKSNNAVHLATF